ncbi:MAG: GerMN domain-containing protein [Acidimicrobiia bacterium]
MATPHRWLYLVLGVAPLLFGGCGIRTAEQPTLIDDREVPFGLLDESSIPPTTAPPPREPVPQPRDTAPQITICKFDNDRLTEVRRVGAAGVEGVLSALVSGVPPEERDRGLTTAVFDPAVVRGMSELGGVVSVDLARSFTDAGASDQLRMIAELVCSLTAQPGIGQVAFALENQAVAAPRGDGSTTYDPVSREDYIRYL